MITPATLAPRTLDSCGLLLSRRPFEEPSDAGQSPRINTSMADCCHMARRLLLLAAVVVAALAAPAGSEAPSDAGSPGLLQVTETVWSIKG